MARRGRGRGQRDINTISNQRLLTLTRVDTLLQMIEDRRRFHPDRDLRHPSTFTGFARLQVPARTKRAKRVAPGRALYMAPSPMIGFEAPRKVLVCVRRKQRREVLHALRKTGRGSGGGFKRRNYWSEISC